MKKTYPSQTPEAVRARLKAWRLKNPEKAKAQQMRYRARYPGVVRNAVRAWRRKQLAAPPPYEPPKHCEACGDMLSKPCLDHCHKTNTFRGWLCGNCNSALGMLGDAPDKVRRLLKYIEGVYARADSALLE